MRPQAGCPVSSSERSGREKKEEEWKGGGAGVGMGTKVKKDMESER